jgi:hypothetical protein
MAFDHITLASEQAHRERRWRGQAGTCAWLLHT